MFSRRTLLLSTPGVLAAAARPRVVFVCGDHEYSGEHTLPLLAQALERDHGLACTVLKSHPDQNAETNIPGLEALEGAALAVFYLRWRKLPKEQLEPIRKYAESGKPIMGFRTTSHAFNYPAGDPLRPWNGWAADVFGAPPGWGADGHTHYGHLCSTDVEAEPSAAKHPVLKGVTPKFHVRSWLYKVRPKWPPAEAQVLLNGTAVNPNKPAEVNPVAWTLTNRHRARAFFTTMGHPEDFAVEAFQQLCVNAVHWCLNRKPKKWKGPLTINVPYRGMVKSQG
jgi:type 1 glutamine amidotransferase